MKATKAQLLDAINQAFIARDTANARWVEAVAKWQEDRRVKWAETKAPQWKALRDLLTKNLNKGVPITSAMVNSCLKTASGSPSSYYSDHVFNPKADPPSGRLRHPDGSMVGRPANIPTEQLNTLKLFLEGSPDEEFSLESLSRMGFKAPSWVFRAAVANAV